MFANTNIFTDKVTTNWFKACIALTVTKDGLSSFVESELQKIQTTVGRSCGNCSIEKLLPCPTNGICKKRKGNTCIFHHSQQPQNCKSCDQVKQNITSLHRFNGPSWRNTQAERWATHPWEIGKCFLPPDGYSGVSSVQESDFNGVISIMLNCTHFQTCLSSSCLSPPPPDKQCLLEKVRQIGRDIRHTSDCKVSDAHLQDYFQTLSTLLADPKCLLNDPSAKISKTKLGDLQNDRMSLSELGELLKEADRTLKNANEVGERVSEAAERKLAECLEQLEASLQAGEKRIQSRIDDGKQRIEQAIQDGKQHIGVKIQNGERCIESKIDNGKQHIEQTIQDGEKRIEAKIQDGENRIIQTNSEQAEQNYTRSVEEMLGALMIHYDRTLSHFPSSPLNDWCHARLDDVYMPPYMLLMEKDKGSFKKTETQITKYQNVLNQQTFIQGEAGSGKSSFLAKLVMDWCGIAKTTQTREPVMIQETNYAESVTRAKKSTFFDDLTSLKSYKFVFYITLRDSVKVFEILQMIREQLIDEIYSSQEDREKAYILVNEIMKHERCLVLLDGLDEWKSPDDRHHLPTLVAIHTQCDLVITTRPWKLAEAKIPDSKVETLLHLEGVNEPFDVSLRILRCREDCTNSEDVKNKHSAFVSYVYRNNLCDLLASPMLLTLIVQTWAEGTELKGNKCQIYSLLLESLFKKANSEEDHFHKTPFPCLKETRYIKPNIEHFNRFSEAAFHLLFSEKKENSLVFGIEQLTQYKLYERKDFALRTGILSATRKASTLRSSSSFSFVHKSVQEFLAAFYIACNCHVIDEVISGYLKRHENSYEDIYEVLIFLCGLNISAANELSILMNNASCACDCRNDQDSFQEIILDGYKEAVANEQDGIRLALSHFDIDDENIRDLYNIWASNPSVVRSFKMELCENDITEKYTRFDDKNTESPKPDKHNSTTESSKIASRIEFDLSSCDELTDIYIVNWNWIWIKGDLEMIQFDYSTSLPAFPTWIVFNSSDCSPMLPSVVHIRLEHFTVSSNWLRKLFNEHFKLEHEMTCELIECRMVGDKLFPCFTASMRLTIGVNNTFEIFNISEESPGLWETLRGLNIKTLSLGMHDWEHDEHDFVLKVKYASSFSQALTSLKNLETLRIYVEAITPDLWSALYSLDIKRVALSLYDHLDGLILSHVGMLSQPSFSVSQIDLIYIDVNSKPDLLTALHGLNIKGLSLCGSGESLDLNQVLLLVTLLTSLEQLEYLCIYVNNESLGLWFALKFLNIKILDISIRCEGFKVNHAAYLATLLPSLKNLETIQFHVTDDMSVLLEVLYGLKIKSLKCYERQYTGLLEIDLTYYSSGLLEAHNSLNVRSLCLQLYRDRSTALTMTHKSSLYHSLSSHTELETLSIQIPEDSTGLCEALRCLNVKTLHLTASNFRVDIENAHQILPSLMSLTQLETLSIELYTKFPGFMRCEFNHSLTSLKCLKVFNMYMTDYFQILLPQCLKDVTIYCESLTPLELRDLIQTLALCCQAVEVKLEFGCARVMPSGYKCQIPPEDYIPIQHEMNALKNVTIRRFRIWNRPFASSIWSACYIGNIASEDHIDDSDDDERYNKFINKLNDWAVNRISIRLQIVTSIDLINK